MNSYEKLYYVIMVHKSQNMFRLLGSGLVPIPQQYRWALGLVNHWDPVGRYTDRAEAEEVVRLLRRMTRECADLIQVRIERMTVRQMIEQYAQQMVVDDLPFLYQRWYNQGEADYLNCQDNVFYPEGMINSVGMDPIRTNQLSYFLFPPDIPPVA